MRSLSLLSPSTTSYYGVHIRMTENTIEKNRSNVIKLNLRFHTNQFSPSISSGCNLVLFISVLSRRELSIEISWAPVPLYWNHTAGLQLNHSFLLSDNLNPRTLLQNVDNNADHSSQRHTIAKNKQKSAIGNAHKRVSAEIGQ